MSARVACGGSAGLRILLWISSRGRCWLLLAFEHVTDLRCRAHSFLNILMNWGWENRSVNWEGDVVKMEGLVLE